jgi:hypothetical protein
MGLLDSVGGFVKDAGDGIARAAGNGYKAANDTWNSALEDAKVGANVVAASVRDSDAKKEQIGSWIDSKEHQLENKVDQGRAWLREHGGVAGKVASAQIGLVEGVGVSLYDAGKGIVQLADGVTSLTNPLEWAANPGANIARLKSGVEAAATLGKIVNLAQPMSWIADPKGNAQMTGALWNGVATSFNKDPAKFIGNAAGTIGTMFIPGAGVAGDVGKAAAITGDVGKAAAITGDVGKVAAITGDVGKVAAITGDAGKAAAVTGDMGKATAVTEDIGKAAAVTEDTGKAAKVTGDASKADVFETSRMGNIEPPRTPGLGERAPISELVEQGAIPGAKGVVLTGVGNPAELYGDMFKLSQQNGIEYALTREGDNLVLRSGSANKVAIPSHAEPLAHTHPFDPATELPQALPSRADVNVLNDRWNRAPNGPPPASDIIWGSGPDQVTRYHATGLDLIPDPTKGGLKPGRTWK